VREWFWPVASVAALATGACDNLLGITDPSTGDGGSTGTEAGSCVTTGPGTLKHVEPFAGHETAAPGQTDEFMASAQTAGDAVVLFVGCQLLTTGSATIAVTAAGWDVEKLTTTTDTAMMAGALFGAIAPNNVLASFSVSVTNDTPCINIVELGDEFTGNSVCGVGMAFDSSIVALGSGSCDASLPVHNRNDAVWGACFTGGSATPGTGYTLSASDGAGDITEFKLTMDPSGETEHVEFGGGGSASYATGAVTILPAP
jgi:hypothetical protein